MVKNKSSNGTSNLKYNRHNASKPKFNIQKIKMKGQLFKKSPIKSKIRLSQHIKTKIKHRNQLTKDQNERTTSQKETYSIKSKPKY